MLENNIAIEVVDVCKSFHQGSSSVEALKNVNLKAIKNELLMIVGPSGCGKTTLLSVIAGTLRFNSGSVDVFQIPLQTLSESELTLFRQKMVGFIFQQFHLIPTLNCFENVAIPLLLAGNTLLQAKDRAFDMMEKMGLKGREYEKPRNLSGGQQQRIAIARALIHEPKLVICDEPTSALDEETGYRVMELLSAMVKDANRSVIVVTHDNRIFKYADRIVKMNDGKIL